MLSVADRRRTAKRGRGALRLRIQLGIAAAIIVILLLAAFVLPLPHNPDSTDAIAVLQPPSRAFWFGTDEVGADIFSRTIRAARTDLPLAMGGTAVAMFIGVPLGILFSVSRRWGERAMRVLDGFQSLPLLVLILALVGLSGNQLYMVVIAIAIFGAPLYIRLVRSHVLTLRESRFIEAARATGASPYRVMRRHLLPNLRELILAQTSLILALSIVAIASLSFLGIGVQPPTPSWGQMIQSGANGLIAGQWWLVVFPGAAIFVSVLSFNVIADTLVELDQIRTSL